MLKSRRLQPAANEAPRAPTLNRAHTALAALVFVLPLACHKGGLRADITHAELQRRSPHCSDYVGSYTSTAKDVNRGTSFKGSLTITSEEDKCVFVSNGIPNHDFNDGGDDFINTVQEVTQRFTLTRRPTVASSTTPLSTSYDNAIFLNGAKLDLMAAACYGVADEKIDCFDDLKGVWRFDPMHKANGFGADTHNAHAQPDGSYHYHGDPRALYKLYADSEPQQESAVIGFAADGFPIHGPYIRDDQGRIRKVRSGYILKAGDRQPLGSEGEGQFPGATYDGRFRQDYEFKGKGDLDECNGMVHNGSYGYYVTDKFPWVIGCFKGTPDDSFKKPAQESHAH